MRSVKIPDVDLDLSSAPAQKDQTEAKYSRKSVIQQQIADRLYDLKKQGYDVSEFEPKLKTRSFMEDVGAGAKIGALGYASTLARVAGADDARDTLNKKRETTRMRSNLGPSLAGEILLDPINLAPGGLVRSGGKAARMLKSGVLGAGIGAGAFQAKEYGSDLDSETRALGTGLSAAAGGGINALIAGLTRGKVKDASELQKAVKQEAQGPGKAPQKTQTDEDIASSINRQRSAAQGQPSTPDEPEPSIQELYWRATGRKEQAGAYRPRPQPAGETPLPGGGVMLRKNTPRDQMRLPGQTRSTNFNLVPDRKSDQGMYAQAAGRRDYLGAEPIQIEGVPQLPPGRNYQSRLAAQQQYRDAAGMRDEVFPRMENPGLGEFDGMLGNTGFRIVNGPGKIAGLLPTTRRGELAMEFDTLYDDIPELAVDDAVLRDRVKSSLYGARNGGRFPLPGEFGEASGERYIAKSTYPKYFQDNKMRKKTLIAGLRNLVERDGKYMRDDQKRHVEMAREGMLEEEVAGNKDAYRMWDGEPNYYRAAYNRLFENGRISELELEEALDAIDRNVQNKSLTGLGVEKKYFDLIGSDPPPLDGPKALADALAKIDQTVGPPNPEYRSIPFVNPGHLGVGAATGTSNAANEYSEGRDPVEGFLKGVALGTGGSAAVSAALRKVAPEVAERLARELRTDGTTAGAFTPGPQRTGADAGPYVKNRNQVDVKPEIIANEDPGIAGRAKGAVDNVVRRARDDIAAGEVSRAASGVMGSMRSGIGRAADAVGDFFKPIRNTPGAYQDARDIAHTEIQTAVQQIDTLYRALSKMSPEAREQMHNYMVGDAAPGGMSPSVRKLADNLRADIDRLGQETVDLGILSQEAFDQWKGKYLHRSYQGNHIRNAMRHLNPNNKQLDRIYQRGMKWRGTQEKYDEYSQAGLLGRAADGKIEAIERPDGTYEFRRDYTFDERTNLGEVRDAAFTVPETMARLHELIAHGKMLKATKGIDDVVQKPSADLPAEELEAMGFKKASGQKWGALNGRYIRKDVYDDIAGMQNLMLGPNSDVAKLWRQYLSTWKKSKTVWNTKAQLNNFLSNFTFQFMDGRSAKSIVASMRSVLKTMQADERLQDLRAKRLAGTLTDDEAKEIDDLMRDPMMQYMQEGRQNGLFGRSRMADILMGHLRPAQKRAKTLAGRGLQWADDKAVKAYRGGDDANRLSYYSYLRSEMGMSEQAAKKRVLEVMPDYSESMHPGARFMRNAGIVPFVSWTYYTLPAIARQMNPVARNVHGQRSAVQMAKVVAVLSAAHAAFGVNPLDEEDAPKGVRFKRMPIGRDGDMVHTLKVDRWIPHYEFMNPAEWARTTLTSGVPQRFAYNLGGLDPYYANKVTFREGAPAAYDWAKYIAGNYLPIPQTAQDLAGAIEDAMIGEKGRRRHPIYQPRTGVQEMLGALGLNVMTYDQGENQRRVRHDRLKN